MTPPMIYSGFMEISIVYFLRILWLCIFSKHILSDFGLRDPGKRYGNNSIIAVQIIFLIYFPKHYPNNFSNKD